MTYQKIELDGEEELVGLFFREENGLAQECAVIDFERRPHVNEGGISFSRSKLITIKDIIEPKKRGKKWRFGVAVVKAELFLHEGYTFLFNPASESGETHVCLHCPSCNLQEYDCVCNRLSTCPFDKEEDDLMRQIIAIYMQVLIPALETKEVLLKVFSSDVEQTNIEAANDTYLKRWENHVRSRSLS